MPGRTVHLTDAQVNLLLRLLDKSAIDEPVIVNSIIDKLIQPVIVKPRKPIKVKPTKALLVERAEQHRQAPTKAEAIFLGRLNYFAKANNLEVICQQPFMLWIFDFYVKDTALMIEIDGGIHNTLAQRKKDKAKQRAAKQKGFTIIRIKNEEVEDFVLEGRIKVSERGKNRHEWLVKNGFYVSHK